MGGTKYFGFVTTAATTPPAGHHLQQQQQHPGHQHHYKTALGQNVPQYQDQHQQPQFAQKVTFTSNGAATYNSANAFTIGGNGGQPGNNGNGALAHHHQHQHHHHHHQLQSGQTAGQAGGGAGGGILTGGNKVFSLGSIPANSTAVMLVAAPTISTTAASIMTYNSNYFK